MTPDGEATPGFLLLIGYQPGRRTYAPTVSAVEAYLASRGRKRGPKLTAKERRAAWLTRTPPKAPTDPGVGSDPPNDRAADQDPQQSKLGYSMAICDMLSPDA